MGKFSWDDRDPFEGMPRARRDRRPMWIAFMAAIMVGASVAYLLKHGISG